METESSILKGTLNIGPLAVSPPMVLAPMAGITNWPMRMISRMFGAPLAYTEMVPAAAVARGIFQPETLYALKTHPHDRPLCHQLFGAKPDDVAEAARALSAMDADLIDINMGCPVKKVVRSGAGVALMCDLDRAREMVKKTRAACRVPLTVKMLSA